MLLYRHLLRLEVCLWFKILMSFINQKKAAEDTFAAMELANMIFQDIHYIDNETAAANLEMAQIKSVADALNEVM